MFCDSAEWKTSMLHNLKCYVKKIPKQKSGQTKTVDFFKQASLNKVTFKQCKALTDIQHVETREISL